MGTAEETTGARVTLEGVRKTFRTPGGDVEAIAPLDLEVAPGEFVALVGPSGCGKSTLLRVIAGLERADAGAVRADSGGAIAFVFQDAQLLPWRTVAANVALPLELRGVGVDERYAAVRRALEQVELADAGHRYPAELSGGMRMRASIARALVVKPRLLLMDEPFAALDELTRQRLDERLRALWASERMTTVFVTHAIYEAAFLAERAVVMSRRPGRIVHDARIDLPAERTPALRGEPVFARACAELLSALERGAWS